jgi:hypothetical protein
MPRLLAVVALGLAFAVLPAQAGEIVEYKGAVLLRQEERGFMVFKTKDGEIRAQPSGTMKGYDLNGKEYSSSFAAAEKQEHALQLLKVGNELDIKIDKVNAKTFRIAEVRLVKGEVLTAGKANKVEKPDDKKKDAKPDDKKPATGTDEAKKPSDTKPEEKKPVAKKKDETHSYAKAVIKKYEGKTLTFEVKGEEKTAEVSGSFKATDLGGQVLRKDDRFRVFKEGNEATISTKISGNKEILTSIRVTHGVKEK